jgi:hypothetical protein
VARERGESGRTGADARARRERAFLFRTLATLRTDARCSRTSTSCTGSGPTDRFALLAASFDAATSTDAISARAATPADEAFDRAPVGRRLRRRRVVVIAAGDDDELLRPFDPGGELLAERERDHAVAIAVQLEHWDARAIDEVARREP